MWYERCKDFYRTGWRPALGWVIAAAFAMKFVVGNETPIADLIALIASGGGLAGLRAWEKSNGAE